MSIYRLVNISGQDILIDGDAGKTVLSNGTQFDLIENGMCVDDIIGLKGGRYFDTILSYITSGQCYMHDGTKRLRKQSAIYLLKTGVLLDMCGPWTMSPQETPNFMDPSSWVQGWPVYTLNVASGKELHILSSTVTINTAVNIPIGVRSFFRVYAANKNLLLYNKTYSTIEDLFVAVNDVKITPQIGDPNGKGSSSKVLATTTYPNESQMVLLSSMAMSVEIGFEMMNGTPLNINDADLVSAFKGHMKVFLQCRVRDEF